MIHYNGATWAAMATPPGTNRLEGIGGTGKGDIYAVGEGGTIIRFNGTTWTTVASGTTTTLNEVWGSSASDVFVIGQNGTILTKGASCSDTRTSNESATAERACYNRVRGTGSSIVAFRR